MQKEWLVVIIETRELQSMVNQVNFTTASSQFREE